MAKRNRERGKKALWIAAALLGAGTLRAAVAANGGDGAGLNFTAADPNAMSLYLDRGAVGLARCLKQLMTRASILMVTAHPDDEDGGMLAYETRGVGARGTLVTLNRGEGGQNAMSMELYDAMGLERTQELLEADRYYGVDQYWANTIDYGFSKTREEALEKWGYDRVLSDVVRVVRMTRPLVITSVFAGAPTDGHGNHQVAGQMAQEAYLAAGDPTKFPEQIQEGLRPWTPLKVYARVPFFEPTKDHTIYDYATDKYVPLRFHDYVNDKWITETPVANVNIAEGTEDAAAGLTFLQIARQGWGFQKSQNGGGTLPEPAIASIAYHRYGSRVECGAQEKDFYDGIDVSLGGIASLASGGDSGFLKSGLEKISGLVELADRGFTVNKPARIAPVLAQGLEATRALEKEVEASNLAEPGKSDVDFELRSKEKQFEHALTIALGISFNAVVAPAKEPTGPFARFAGSPVTFAIAIPGQAFGVNTHILNAGAEPVEIDKLDVFATDGKDWKIKADAAQAAKIEGGKDARLKFAVKAPDDAVLTKPYFSRPDQEQPYYTLNDARYRNLSFAPYPLEAAATVKYHGIEWRLKRVVQTNRRIEGIGLVEQPMMMGPAISVTVSPAAGAVPLSAKTFDFACTLHSNVKGTAEGALRLELPKSWKSDPDDYHFLLSEGENDTVRFHVSPHDIQPEKYEIQAVATYGGKKFAEGYALTGYPGVRPYPLYRTAAYKAVGVDVKTAEGLRIGFVPGTGDDVPRALEDLGLPVRTLSGDDVEAGDLSGYDAIVLGTRAYSVRPDVRSAHGRLLNYVKNGGTLIIQYNVQDFGAEDAPYSLSLGQNPQKVVDEGSAVKLLKPDYPAMTWPNKLSEADFRAWEEERGHGFMQKWDPHYQDLIETHDPEQDPQAGGLLVARYGHGFYIYDAFALYRQLPAGVPGAYRILANLVSIGKNPGWK